MTISLRGVCVERDPLGSLNRGVRGQRFKLQALNLSWIPGYLHDHRFLGF